MGTRLGRSVRGFEFGGRRLGSGVAVIDANWVRHEEITWIHEEYSWISTKSSIWLNGRKIDCKRITDFGKASRQYLRCRWTSEHLTWLHLHLAAGDAESRVRRTL
jgi:hypothetical protein